VCECNSTLSTAPEIAQVPGRGDFRDFRPVNELSTGTHCPAPLFFWISEVGEGFSFCYDSPT